MKDEEESRRQNKADYNEKYRHLIQEYKQQILESDVCPLQVSKRLEDQKVISKMDLKYINSLTLPKWQRQILFEFLHRSKIEQLNQIKAALTHYDDDTSGLIKIFDEISVRGQHILREARDHGVKLTTRAEQELPIATWLPYQLFESAFAGNVKQLVEVFVHVTSLQMFLDLIQQAGNEMTGNGISPLHVACGLNGVKVDFVDCLTQLIQLLINSEGGSPKTARMLNFKAIDDLKNPCPRIKDPSNDHVEIRVLEDFLNVIDSHGRTALHWAAMTHLTDTCKFLYDKRADIFIKNDHGDSPIELMFEFSPEVVRWILNDHIPPIKRQRDDDIISLDMTVLTGCRSRVTNPMEGQMEDTAETQLLAQMVLGNMDESSKELLPHILVKTFLDEKWKKLVSPIFVLTSIYILFHLLHTVFLIQVFIVSHPYRSLNETGAEAQEVGGSQNQNHSQDIYTYLLGNWDSPDPIFSQDTSTLSKDLALASKLTAMLMIVAEFFEIWATALCVSKKRDGLRPKLERRWASRRKMDLVIIIILSSAYDQDTLRSLVGIIMLLPFYIYDWIVITSNSRDKNKKRRFSALVVQKIFKISINSIIIFLSTSPFAAVVNPPSNAAWLTIVLAGICILMEIFNAAEYLLTNFLQLILIISTKLRNIFRRNWNQNSKSQNEQSPQSFPLIGVETQAPQLETQVTSDQCQKEPHQHCRISRTFLSFMVTFWKGTLAYLTNLENILQLTYIAIIVVISDSIHKGNLTKGLYRGAAISVVLAFILILMQIGHIYGLGKYIHMLRTVVKSFLGVMGIYMSLLVAFALSFSIIFPNETRFESLPSSFFRVVSMMAGELNYDDIFYPETPNSESNSFPYASQWLHLVFVLAVVIILINLLIGLTVSDIQKIQDKSDVIYRSVQVERIYIMEIFFQTLANFLSFFCCCCGRGPFHFSVFNVLKGSCATMQIKWNTLTPTLKDDFLQARKELEESQQVPNDDDPTTKTSLSNQISLLFEDKMEIENLPLHWLPFLKDDKETQEKISSISHKDFLTANEYNRDLLGQLSTFPVHLKMLRMSLEKCSDLICADETLEECQKHLFTILLKNTETLNRLEINWNCLPDSVEIPKFPKLISLHLIKIKNEQTATLLETPNQNGSFIEMFPNVSNIEICGPLTDFKDLDTFLPSQIFESNKHFKQIKSLKIEDGSESESDETVIQMEVFEKLGNLFPRINRLEISGGVTKMTKQEDVIPQFWRSLKLVQPGGEIWIKNLDSEVGSPDSTPFKKFNRVVLPTPDRINDENDDVTIIDDSPIVQRISDGSISIGSRFGSGLAGRLRNFWSRSSIEDEYKLLGNGMGYILIVNNLIDDFQQQVAVTPINLEKTRGAWEDALRVDRLFRELNFRTRLERNVSSTDLPIILDDFKAECIRYNYHSCFVFLMTHSNTSQVDMTVLMNDLVSINLVNDVLCRMTSNDLGDIPKVFFIHACQLYSELDFDEKTASGSSTRSTRSHYEFRQYPGIKNTLVCTSTSPFKMDIAKHQKEEGSLFIKGIESVFKEKAGSCSLQEMLSMVQGYVYEQSSNSQIPSVINFDFNRQYRFHKLKGNYH